MPGDLCPACPNLRCGYWRASSATSDLLRHGCRRSISRNQILATHVKPVLTCSGITRPSIYCRKSGSIYGSNWSRLSPGAKARRRAGFRIGDDADAKGIPGRGSKLSVHARIWFRNRIWRWYQWNIDTRRDLIEQNKHAGPMVIDRRLLGDGEAGGWVEGPQVMRRICRLALRWR